MGDVGLVDQQMFFIGLPLDEFDEAIARARRLKDPGARTIERSRMAHVAPEPLVIVGAVEWDTSSCDEQVALQRISQISPIAMVPMPVN